METKTILLIEDEVFFARIYSKQIKSLGYEVVCAFTAEEALRIVKSNHLIHLVIMDINLGKGTNGADAARQILEIKNIPIVFHTSHTEKEYIEKIEKIEHYGYIIKNSNDFVLKSAIETAFNLIEARKQKIFYSFLFENISEGVAYCKMHFERDKPLDITCLKVNKAFETQTGFKNVTGKKITEIIPNILEIDSNFIEICGRVAKTGIPESVEIYLNTLEMWLALDIYSPEQDHFLAVFNVITERKRSDSALIQAKERIQFILESITDIYICFDKDWRFVDLNKQAEKVFGKSRLELLDKVYWDVFPQAVGSEVYKKVIVAMKERIPMNFEEYSIGAQRWAEFHVYPTEEGLEFYVRDISERKKSEEKIKILLAEKEIMLKEVHHRIKNNMSVMISMLMLQIELLEDTSAKSALMDAQGRLRSMGVLYDKLYLTESYDNLSIRNYLFPLVDEIIANFPNRESVKVEKKIEDFKLEPKSLQSIGIIINELLTNIMKYAFKGRKDGLITINAVQKEGQALITIQDNGIGMPEAVDFNHPEGFGLILVEMLIQQINGNIAVERNNGTKIKIKFKI